MTENNSFHIEYGKLKATIVGRFAITVVFICVLTFGAGVMYFGGSQALGWMFPTRAIEAVK